MRHKLRASRENKKLSVQEFANMLNISSSFYYKIEQANRNPTILLAKKIADILNDTVDRLFYAEKLDETSNGTQYSSQKAVNE